MCNVSFHEETCRNGQLLVTVGGITASKFTALNISLFGRAGTGTGLKKGPQYIDKLPKTTRARCFPKL